MNQACGEIGNRNYYSVIPLRNLGEISGAPEAPTCPANNAAGHYFSRFP